MIIDVIGFQFFFLS